MKKTLVAVMAVVTSGCVTGVPEGMPSAMLRFTADGYESQIYPVCPEDRRLVKVGLVNNRFWNEVSPVQMHGTVPEKNNRVIERLIPAGRRIGFTFTASQPKNRNEYYACNVVFAFSPVAGEQYQADYVWPTGAERCSVKLSRLSLVNGVLQKSAMPVGLYPLPERDKACET